MKGFVYKRKISSRYIDYWKKEKLDKYFLPINKEIEYDDPYFNIKKQKSISFPADIRDLVNLHKLIRKRKAFTVLEFGIGFSSIIIADALQKNKNEFEKFKDRTKIRKNNLFEVHSIDSDRFWINKTKKHFPRELRKIFHPQYSTTEISKFDGRICHMFKKLPNIIPDFIYVDGPAAYDVKGSINGISFSNIERTVMNGDLLSIEPYFTPGTYILIDGRTNSARFLKNNFQRKYIYRHNKINDTHSFELDESPLGVHNRRIMRYCGLFK
jgi:hypothetical protein